MSKHIQPEDCERFNPEIWEASTLVELPPWPVVFTPGEKSLMVQKAMEVGHPIILRTGPGPINFPWPWGNAGAAAACGAD